MIETRSPSQPPAPPIWSDALLSNPHEAGDKRRRVQRMFAAIAPTYDLNNRLHSLWRDQAWRRKAVRLAQLRPGDQVVDVACGTGDLALAFHRGLAGGGGRVCGIDFTFEMLPIARQKATGLPIQWLAGDAQALPLPDHCADVASIAFGIRNVVDPLDALREFNRILRPGGRVVILEFSLPTLAPLRAIYNFYFKQVLPRTATWISGDRTGAYKYLPRSVNTFIGREAMLDLLTAAGFAHAEAHPLTFGICVCYRAEKR